MHWPNYRTLVNYLKTMDPLNFDYGKYWAETEKDRCGCVALCIGVLAGERSDGWEEWDQEHIVAFLQCSYDEALFLFGTQGLYGLEENLVTALKGAEGINEALRRLGVVAARHGGCPDEIAPSTFKHDEQAFLASVRALAKQPAPVSGGTPGEAR